MCASGFAAACTFMRDCACLLGASRVFIYCCTCKSMKVDVVYCVHVRVHVCACALLACVLVYQYTDVACVIGYVYLYPKVYISVHTCA